MKLPLTTEAGTECAYLKDANGVYIAKSIGDDANALKELSLLRAVANAFPRALEKRNEGESLSTKG